MPDYNVHEALYKNVKFKALDSLAGKYGHLVQMNLILENVLN